MALATLQTKDDGSVQGGGSRVVEESDLGYIHHQRNRRETDLLQDFHSEQLEGYICFFLT